MTAESCTSVSKVTPMLSDVLFCAQFKMNLSRNDMWAFYTQLQKHQVMRKRLTAFKLIMYLLSPLTAPSATAIEWENKKSQGPLTPTWCPAANAYPGNYLCPYSHSGLTQFSIHVIAMSLGSIHIACWENSDWDRILMIVTITGRRSNTTNFQFNSVHFAVQ